MTKKNKDLNLLQYSKIKNKQRTLSLSYKNELFVILQKELTFLTIICDDSLYLLNNKNSVHLPLVKILIEKKHTVGTTHLLAIK